MVNMNKRQSKKRRKKLILFSSLDFVDIKCRYCENYECGDSSVGLSSGCTGEYLYDMDGEIIEAMGVLSEVYQLSKGYICPHYLAKKMHGRKAKFNIPKTYKQYKEMRKKEIEFFKTMYEESLLGY